MLAAITDGLSNTAIWSERVKGTNDGNPGLGQIYVNTAITFNGSVTASSPTWSGSLQTTLQTINATCTTAKLGTWHRKGGDWLYQSRCVGGGYTHIQPPNRTACFFNGDSGVPSSFTDRNQIGASSRHSGGVNVGKLDGSVRFVKESTHLGTWGGLATMAGGEIISADGLRAGDR